MRSGHTSHSVAPSAYTYTSNVSTVSRRSHTEPHQLSGRSPVKSPRDEHNPTNHLVHPTEAIETTRLRAKVEELSGENQHLLYENDQLRIKLAAHSSDGQQKLKDQMHILQEQIETANTVRVQAMEERDKLRIQNDSLVKECLELRDKTIQDAATEAETKQLKSQLDRCCHERTALEESVSNLETQVEPMMVGLKAVIQERNDFKPSATLAGAADEDGTSDDALMAMFDELDAAGSKGSRRQVTRVRLSDKFSKGGTGTAPLRMQALAGMVMALDGPLSRDSVWATVKQWRYGTPQVSQLSKGLSGGKGPIPRLKEVAVVPQVAKFEAPKMYGKNPETVAALLQGFDDMDEDASGLVPRVDLREYLATLITGGQTALTGLSELIALQNVMIMERETFEALVKDWMSAEAAEDLRRPSVEVRTSVQSVAEVDVRGSMRESRRSSSSSSSSSAAEVAVSGAGPTFKVSKKDLLGVYETLDEDKAGYVPKRELKPALERLSQESGDPEVDRFIILMEQIDSTLVEKVDYRQQLVEWNKGAE